MKKTTHILGLVLFALAGCSSGGRNQRVFNNQNVPVAPGGRLAAVLSKETGCNPGTFSGQSVQQNAADPFNQGITKPNISRGTLRGGGGRLDILGLYESTNPFVGGPGTIVDPRVSGSTLPTGAVARLIGSSANIPGITDESQITYTTDGSVVLVTVTGLDQVWGIPALDKGGLGLATRIGVGARPTEIASAFNKDLGEIAAIATDTGLSIIRMDRYNLGNGTLVPGAYYTAQPIVRGRITSVAFSPRAEWLFLGVDPARNGRAPGEIRICNVAILMQEEETLQQSFESIELLRGCYRSDPSSMIGQPMYAGGYPHIGSGVEQIMGTPTKLAVNGTLAVALSNRVGPYILESPPLSDMDDDLQQFVQSGAIERIGWARSNVSTLDRNFADIAIHPISGYPMALAGNKIITYPKDNAAQIGSVLNPIQAVRPVALAMDPGPNPEFALIADEGAGKVLVGQLSAVSVRFNPLSDFVQLNACPIDVSIRTRTQARRPFAQNPNEKAEAKTQSSQQ